MLDTTQLSSALTTLADTFKDTPPDLKIALEGVARFSDTLNNRDAQLRNLLANANKVTAVLAKRSDQIASLVVNTNALLAELLSQRNSVDVLLNNLTAVSHQISGLVNDNRTQLKPAVDKLNGVLAILDNRKKELQRTLYLLRRYAMSFGEVLGAGPFFKASLVNLAPGQFAQPFIDSAFSDLGLDPNVLLPSQLVDPGVGQPGTPALPVPYPRTGQGGEPNLTLPDAITGKPGDQGCGPPGVPLPGPTGCYPYREPLPAPPPGGPPPGPPALAPAPGELPPPRPSGHPARVRGRAAMMSGRTTRIAIATTLVAILAWRSPWSPLRGGTRSAGIPSSRTSQNQRSLRRRRGPYPGCRRRNRGRDRPATERREGHLLGRQGVPGARRCPGGDPVAVTRQRTRDPAGARLLRRPETGRRRHDSEGAHRGSRRVGRSASAAGEAHRLVAAHHPRRP